MKGLRPDAIVVPRISLFLGIFIVLVLAWSQEASADPPALVRVSVIHAKKGPPFLHDGVKPLWDTLRKTFGGRFAYFDLLSSTERHVEKQGRVEVRMPDQGMFAVVYRGVSEDGRFVKVTIEHDDLKSRVRIHDGGLFFQAGKRWQGGVLIVGVRVTLIPR